MSERGFDFSVREADICFIGGRDEAETRAASLRAKELAAKLGKAIKTYAMCTVIYGGSDAAAETTAQTLSRRAGRRRGAGHAGKLWRNLAGQGQCHGGAGAGAPS